MSTKVIKHEEGKRANGTENKGVARSLAPPRAVSRPHSGHLPVFLVQVDALPQTP